MRRTALALAISALLLHTAHAQQSGREAARLEAITVTADPLAEPGDELLQPTEVLAGSTLDDQRAGTLGETVAGLVGVQSSYFGPGVGRPIVRGLEGPRVQVLGDGVSTLDVSTTSVDHALSIDPFLADQIEVLKGPATLLYGSGAIGGVVNVREGRIPDRPIDGIQGRVELRADSVNDGRAAVGRIDAGNGLFAVHADWSRREGDSYEGPDGVEIENTQSDSDSRAVGFSITGDRGHVGIALSAYDAAYGIPPEEDEDEDEAAGASISKGSAARRHGKGGEGKIELDMDQRRVDLDARLLEPLSGWEKVDLRIGRNDYEHAEIKLDEGGEIGTQFFNDAIEGRIEAVHSPIGAWRGAVGIQASRRDFEALGDEAFVPPSETRDFGLFVVERAQFEPFSVELGARLDRQTVELDAGGSVKHRPVSLSAAGRWDFAEQWHASLNLDRAQRAPQAEELFSDGPHEATGSFEIGDPDLDEETANQVEIGLHWHAGTTEARVSAYHNRFDDFIFLAETGEEEDDLPVRVWTQADARFTGIEAEIKAQLADTAWGRWDGRLFADAVRGRLDDGGDLPRIAPGRFGAALDWSYEGWRAGIDVVRTGEQDRIAAFETPTDGYTLVDARLAWRSGPDGDWEVFVEGRNLTDASARVHTSLIKDRAPLPGRNVLAGIRLWF
ncbi:MAG: TonB-dependent receptor [Xanthomonadaceae bacterium]|jgi:iron complex outermembrane receptor protein|nr:TonB-dependent receptor [Xanthomonadaceae bacterium]